MEQIIRETFVRVRYRDTDQMGVVYHGVYFEYFETGRTEMLRQLGLPYASLEESGVMLPVLSAHVDLKKPARYDDLLRIVSAISTTPSARLKIAYQIFRNTDLLTTGFTEHAFTTVDTMRPIRPPAIFLEVLTMAESACK